MKETRKKRLSGRRTGLVFAAAAAVMAGGVACSSASPGAPGGDKPSAPEAFGPAGYRGLTLGMAKDAALAGGKLAAAPTSTLDGCADFPYAGGPAPDPARMKAEADAAAKANDLNKQADELQANPDKGPGPNASAQEYADSAEKSAKDTKVFADAAQATADLATRREARDKAFVAAGGASFGKDGLREIAAPAEAKTAEGIGAGSSLNDLKTAYDARGMKAGENGRFQLPIAEKPDWIYEFTTADGGKVGSVSMINPKSKCA